MAGVLGGLGIGGNDSSTRLSANIIFDFVYEFTRGLVGLWICF